MEANGRQYLYDIVYTALKKSILDGEFKAGDLMLSEKDLAQNFKVERTTVRKALKLLVEEGYVEKKPGIGTRVIFKRIEDTVQTTDRKSVIGFFMANEAKDGHLITQPYFPELFYLLENLCNRKGFQLMYVSLNETTNITETLTSQNFYMVIFVSYVDSSYIEKAVELNVPVLQLFNDNPHTVSLSYDNAAGAYSAMKYLIEMGHENIAIIAGPDKYYSTRKKLEGCYRALSESGILLSGDNIVRSENWKFESGFNCAKEIFLNPDRAVKPTALFVFNDMMAIGAIRALRELQYRVPEDVSVIGFDRIEQLKYMEPELSTVDTSSETLAAMIVDDDIMNLVRKKECPLQIQTPVKLVEGKTVKKK